MRNALFTVILTMLFFNSRAQVIISNPGFELRDTGFSTAGKEWNNGGEFIQCATDSNITWKGKYSMHILREKSAGYGFFYQDFPFLCKDLKKYKISCAVKTRNVNERSAGIGARIYDKDGRTIGGYNAIDVRNTQDWKVYSGEFYSDEAAAKTRIFCNLRGAGEAWFDDISIEEIPIRPEKMAANVDKYISEYFTLLRANTIVKDTAHISELERKTRRLCAGNADLNYCHGVLQRYTTLRLNDGHSFFSTPREWKDWQNGDKTVKDGWANFADGKMMEGNIAYINVPTFVSFDSLVINKAVDSLHTIIAMLDKQNPRGWIIDVSNNPGGNSFVMLCGLGPILGDGICGYSMSADGSRRTRIHNEGWTGWDTTLMVKRSNPYKLKNTDLPITVLYSNTTASSGEVVAIAFRGKPDTRSFGQETHGSTTRVDNLKLSDGAYLNLAAGYDADRSGVVYKGKVPPDVLTKDHAESLKEAAKWILEKGR